jgi:hypothetical protein
MISYAYNFIKICVEGLLKLFKVKTEMLKVLNLLPRDVYQVDEELIFINYFDLSLINKFYIIFIPIS